MHPALRLALAIGSEIMATTSLKLSDGFSLFRETPTS
jgi:multidrug transporter EmrE-like cation transporter